MADDFILNVLNEGLLLTLVISGPPIALSLVIGVLISIFQALTSIQEQSLTFAPKLIIIFGSLAIMGPWFGSAMAQYGRLCFEGFAKVVGY